MTTRNEAYAFASCADCAAVAVGFQVVLIVGQTDVVVPENLSAAANYNCVQCLTYALASQLVLTLDGPLSDDGMTRLNELWQQIAEYGRNLQNVPLSEIQGRLDAFKAQIMEVIRERPQCHAGYGLGACHDRELAGTQRVGDPRSYPRLHSGHRSRAAARRDRACGHRSGSHVRGAGTRGTAAHAIRRHLHRTGSGDAVAGSHDDGPAGTLGGAPFAKDGRYGTSHSGHLRPSAESYSGCRAFHSSARMA